MLELLLTYPIPRRDTKKLSKDLINHFGSFAAVLDQPRKRLLEIKGIGPETATFLLAIRASMVRYFEQHAEHADTISTPEDIWEQCNRKINRVLNLMKELQEMRSATKKAQVEEILIGLRNMVSQTEPFSSVASTCVRSQGISWLSNAIIR
jgi:hypothetical protein